jgi:hypothetical protein
VFVITFLVQCILRLVGKHPPFADFQMRYPARRLSIKIERFSEMNFTTWKSLLLPLVLVATGIFILAGADLGLVSLDRVQNLWPAALILVGLVELFSDGAADERGQHE